MLHLALQVGGAHYERIQDLGFKTHFLREMLHAQGRERAQRWLSEHAHAVGRHSTVNVAHWLD